MSDRDYEPPKSALVIYVVDRVCSLLGLVIRFGIPAWAAVKIAEALAGEITLARVDVAVDLFKGYGYAVWLLAFASFIAVIWALIERWLRKRKTVYFHSRIQKLEAQLDSSRSSSTLTEAGETNPKDR